jgi:cytosine/adenosine deaminase-related metal-dependent hydrolase
MTRVKEFSRQHNVPIHIHLHETHAEVADSVSGNSGFEFSFNNNQIMYKFCQIFSHSRAFFFIWNPGQQSMACHRSDQRIRPFANLDRLGLIDDKLIAVHMTQLDDAEVARCAQAGVNVVHCPSSNLKLASGMCPIAKLVKAGANVCLGTDSTASNNTLGTHTHLYRYISQAFC